MDEAEPAGWDCPVFVMESRSVTVRDVIQAAHFRGELETSWAELLVLLEGEKRAAVLKLEPDAAALQAVSEQFRYERDLITAEETEDWLEVRGLALDDFSDHFIRRHWQDAPGEQIEPPVLDYLEAPVKLRDLLRVELMLSGEFDRLAMRLCWRLAALQVARHEIAPDLVEAERARFLERTNLDDSSLAGWLARLGCDQPWLEEMLKSEATYRQHCAALLTREAREQMLKTRRMPWTRLDLETIELECRDAAREAFLCVREDGVAMSEVAKTGRYPYRRAEVVCEDLPAETQQKFLCAASGEVLEPIERGESFQLCRLIQKIEPDLADAQIRSRVEQRILECHFSELAARCARWVIPPSSTL